MLHNSILPAAVDQQLYQELQSVIITIDYIKDLPEFPKLQLALVQRLALIRSLSESVQGML